MLSTKVTGFFASNEGLGIQADKGKNFLGVSIAALVFTGLAAMVATVDLVTGRAASKMASAGGDIGSKIAKKMWFGRKGGKKEAWDMDERV